MRQLVERGRRHCQRRRFSISGAYFWTHRKIVEWSTRDAAFTHHLLEVAVAHPVATVPAHRPEHDLALEVASLEVRHGSTLPPEPHPAGPPQGLQQSHPEHHEYELYLAIEDIDHT